MSKLVEDERKLERVIATEFGISPKDFSVSGASDGLGGAYFNVTVPSGESLRISKRLGDEFEKCPLAISEPRHPRG